MSTRTSGKTVFRELGLFTIGAERLNLLGDLVLEARADLQPRNSREFCTALRRLLALRRGNPPPVAETRISEGAPNSQRKDNPTCEPSPTTQPTM